MTENVMTSLLPSSPGGPSCQGLAGSLSKDQSDQDWHCLPFCLHLLNAFLYSKVTLFKFKGAFSKSFGCQKILDFYVSHNNEIIVWILNFWKDRLGQTVQNQMRLLLVVTVCYSIHIIYRYHTMIEPLSLNKNV